VSQTLSPQEINLRKMRWMNDSHDVIFPSDYTTQAKQWCKEHCEVWQWMLEKWVHAYSHAMSFQNAELAQQFEIYIQQLKEKTP